MKELRKRLDAGEAISYAGNGHVCEVFKSRAKTGYYCFMMNGIVLFSFKTWMVFENRLAEYMAHYNLTETD